MNSPTTKEPMIILELEGVEIDYCPGSGGIWLDSGELELLLEDTEEKNILLSSFEVDYQSKEKPVKCPICNSKMEKVLVGKEKNITIDRCKKNHGLWFDEGELLSVVELVSIDKNNKIIKLLKEMFFHNINSKGSGGK